MSELYQCPNCRLIPRARVFQCSMGHIICSECLVRHAECPQCGIAFGKDPIRNLQVEAIIGSKSDTLEFACLYHMKVRFMGDVGVLALALGCLFYNAEKVFISFHILYCQHFALKTTIFNSI